MRRWLIDRVRLALRKALPRLIAFACLPTETEIDMLLTTAMERELHALLCAEIEKPTRRRVLH